MSAGTTSGAGPGADGADGLDDELLTLIAGRGRDLDGRDGVDPVAAFGDAVGVGIAGLDAEVWSRVDRLFGVSDGLPGLPPAAGRRTVDGTLRAVFAHAVAVHALDYDDSLFPGPVHPSCTLVPALLGLGGLVAASGEELLGAYRVGLEACGALAAHLGPEHYRAGWHATSTIGTVATTAACAALLGLPPAVAASALGAAASAGGGLRRNIGSMVKPIHAGTAARSAVLAVLLAREGVTARRDVLGDPIGYLAVYSGGAGRRDPGEVLRPGDRRPALGLKPYPCCGEATSAVEAAIALSARWGPADLVRVVVSASPLARSVMAYDDPDDADQARFSLPYCVAHALRHGRLGLEAFRPEALSDPDVRRLTACVEWRLDGAEVAVDDHAAGSTIEVTAADGSHDEANVDRPLGWAPRALTEDQRRAKFTGCAGRRLGGRVDAAFDALLGLGTADVADLVAELAA